MKAVKSGRHKKGKIVPMNTTSAVVVNKMDKSPEKTHKETSANIQKPQITYDKIAQRAWSIWMSGGCKPGQDDMNWHQAELELRNARNTKGDVCDTDEE